MGSPSDRTTRWNRARRDAFGDVEIGTELSHDILPSHGHPRPLNPTTGVSGHFGMDMKYDEKRRRDDETTLPCPRLSGAVFGANGLVIPSFTPLTSSCALIHCNACNVK
jgi:hypothetical protein